MEFGIFSLIPPLLAIILAVTLKQTVLALFIGGWVGVTMLSGFNPIAGLLAYFGDYVIPSMASDFNANLILFVLFIGAFMGILRRSGATHGLEQLATRKIKSRKGAMFIAWLSCFAFIFTEPPIIIGYIMRPITDKFNISRVKLAYITDSMGAPLATVSPFAPHTSFVASLIAAEIAAIGVAGTGWSMLVASFPFLLYSWLSMGVSLFIVLTEMDFGPMYDAEKRAIEEGKVYGDDDVLMTQELKDYELEEGQEIPASHFFIPLITLIAIVFVYIFVTGNIVENGFIGAFGNTNVVMAITIGVFAALIVASIIALGSKRVNLAELMESFIQGMGANIMIPVILVLAWSIGSIISDLGLPAYLTGFISDANLSGAVPAFSFLVGCVVAFASGSSWGVYSIMLPLAIPIAHATGISIPLAIGASVSGGLFGDHCSPISDTTIMASSSAACDHIQHVNTQLPYCLTIAVSLFIGYLVAGVTAQPVLAIVIGVVLTFAAFIIVHRSKKKKGDILNEKNIA